MQRNLILGRPAVAVLVAVVASVAIAACGGSHRAGASAHSTANARLKFAACVRAHGVRDYPDSGVVKETASGKFSADGRILSESSRAVDGAFSKCQKYEVSMSGPRYSAAQLAKIRTGALAMSKCMRAHGLNYPDLTVKVGPGGHGVELSSSAIGRKNPSLDTPAFKSANIACSRLLNRSMPGGKG
jgi:hypothetical protein